MSSSTTLLLFVGTLLASAPVGICMLDGGLRYRVWNDYLERLLGVAAAAGDALGAQRLERLGYEVILQRRSPDPAEPPLPKRPRGRPRKASNTQTVDNKLAP